MITLNECHLGLCKTQTKVRKTWIRDLNNSGFNADSTGPMMHNWSMHGAGPGVQCAEVQIQVMWQQPEVGPCRGLGLMSFTAQLCTLLGKTKLIIMTSKHHRSIEEWLNKDRWCNHAQQIEQAIKTEMTQGHFYPCSHQRGQLLSSFLTQGRQLEMVK